MRMRSFVLLCCTVSIFSLICSCSNSSDSTENKSSMPGTYSISKIEGSTQRSTPIRSVSLGNITVDSTVSMQFLIKNIGSYAIRNTSITPTVTGITLEDSDFTITPQTISELAPISTAGVDYIVTVTFNHGLVYGKIGTYNLLSGLTKVNLNIAGITSEDGVSYATAVSEDVEINTNVNVADWKIQSSQDGITWTDDTGWGSGGYIWSGTVNDYRRIVNLGNVPIGFLDLNGGAIYDLSDYTEIPVGGVLTIGKSYSIHICTYGVMYNYNSFHPIPSSTTDFWTASIVNEFTQ